MTAALTDLADLTGQIMAEHAAASASLRRGVEHAIRAGELLLEAKRLHRHGQWTKWVADNLSFSDRTARAYMQLARMPIEKRQRVADLPLRETLSAIRCRQDRLAHADERTNRPPPGPAEFVFQDKDGNSVSIPAPKLVVAPEHRHLLARGVNPAPATSEKVADDIIAQLDQVLAESGGDLKIPDLQAAFSRRFGTAQPEQNTSAARSCSGASEVPTTPVKLTSGLPTGSLSQKTATPQAAVVETQAQSANPIIAAWDAVDMKVAIALAQECCRDDDDDMSVFIRKQWAAGEPLREFSRERGEKVIDMFMSRRHSDDPLKYRIYKICNAIENDLGDEEEGDSEEIADLRVEYESIAEALARLELQISEARTELEEEDAEAAS